MAEYQDVMKQMERMCDSNICDKCPIVSYCGKGRSINVSATDADKVEELVMAWAEQHPELVYPTWREYLEEIKVIVPRKNYTVMDTYSPIIGQINTTRVRADIADKLGLEPKEAQHDGATANH